MPLPITVSPSKNFSSRQGYKPFLIVVHCTDGYYPSDLQWLQGLNPASSVSSNYYIAPSGEVHRLVSDENSAWHAGTVVTPTARLLKKDASGKITNPNFYTIGIEVSIRPPATYTPAQWNSLKALIKELSVKQNIPIDRDHVIAHYEIRAGKSCPAPINVDKLVGEILSASPTPILSKEEIKKKIKDLVDQL